MGLNYVRRPVREQFDMPNDFIAQSIGQTYYPVRHYDQHVVLEFMDKRLDAVDQQRIALTNRLLRGG